VSPDVELVFRSVGERTAAHSLELAIRHIRPTKVHVLENVTPFSETVRQMLQIGYTAPQVVFVDADCLIFEDMRPFLDANTLPYVDCYVSDRYRGRLHAGVHITRRDVVEAMRDVRVPADDLKYVLRPESTTRHHALRALGLSKHLVPFRILHDHAQSHAHVFAKYALRELRSRTAENQAKLEHAMASWGDEPDFEVARTAIAFARASVPAGAGGAEVHAFLLALPDHTDRQLAALGIPEPAPMDDDELARWAAFADAHFSAVRPKTFCIGLSRTGTKSLTSALGVLGQVIAHHPSDAATFREITSGIYDLTLLRPNGADGVSDLLPAAFFPELDATHPGSRFIHTVRDKVSWLDAMESHWSNKPIFEDDTDGLDMKVRMRRFLRAAAYGTYTYDRRRLARAYDEHHARVRSHFADRPGDLLEIDIVGGEGWDVLCPFLGEPVLDAPFPRVEAKRSVTVA
jgi:hypothetical protein